MRWLFNALSPGADRARLSILIFHRVLPKADPLFPDEVDAERFDHICAWVRQWFNVLPLPDAARRLREGSLPPRALAITFDDGYADNFDVALPILQRHGLVASFFVATGFIDGGRMWNDTLIESVRRAGVDVLRPEGAAFANTDGTPMALPLAGVAAQRQAIGALIKA
jgi:peptidoglycan/xylan/chitin deacetylase (PgdA/CDA1 family)